MPDIYIPGRGPMHANLIVLGESGGREEEYQQRPFVGPSGKLLTEWMQAAGIDITQVRFENVYPYRPPEGNIKYVPLPVIQQWMHDCLARLDDLTEVTCIVPVGNLALCTLVGFPAMGPQYAQKKLHEQWGFAGGGITNWRGSMLTWWQCSTQRQCKVIPTIHPAAILYRRKRVAQDKAGATLGGSVLWEKRCKLDWERIAREYQSRKVCVPERTYYCDPSDAIIQDFLNIVHCHAWQPLCIDIETYPPEKRITCVSFALAPHGALSIPYSKANKPLLQELCALPNPKAGQNFFYDMLYLHKKGIDVTHFTYDTRHLMHYKDPLESGSLAFQASILTDEPYWKPDSEEAEKHWSGVDHHKLLEYNAKDSAVTCEILHKHLASMSDQDKCNYHAWYTDLYGPLFHIMTHGIRVDQQAAKAAYAQARARSLQARKDACTLVGRPLFKFKTKADAAVYWFSGDPDDMEAYTKAVSKAKRTPAQIEADLDDLMISGQELGTYLKEQGVKLPLSSKNTSGETLDDTALMELRIAHAKKPDIVSVLDYTLEHRRQRKLSEFFVSDAIDPDGYMRCEYGLTTKTNRLSSKENPFGTGRNLQNIPQAARWVFRPDPGHVFLVVDLSQAEARDVYCRTGDPHLIELATSKPWEVDIHRANAALLFGIPEHEITKTQRDDGKVVEHATNYGMGPKRLQGQFFDAGIYKSLAECKQLIAKKFQTKPAILQWQSAMRLQVIRHGRLTNAWGRTIDLTGLPLDDETYKLAYAWCPQSDIGMLMNLRGVVPGHNWLSTGLGRIVTLEHDGMTMSVKADPKWILATIEYLRKSLEAPILIQNVPLSIPCEFKLATSWCTRADIAEAHGQQVREFKRPPGLTEIEETLELFAT